MYRKSLAIAIAYIAYRPRMLPREQEAERIRQAREVHEWAARIIRVGLIVIAVFVWMAAIPALIDGRDGPLFEALL